MNLKRLDTGKISGYEALFSIIKNIHTLENVDTILKKIISGAMKLTGAEAGSIMLKNEEEDCLEFRASVGGVESKVLKNIKIPKKSIAGYIYSTGKSLLVKDVTKDKRFYNGVSAKTGFQTRSIIGVPLRINKDIIGVMEILNSNSWSIFTNEDLKLIEAFASEASVAITNAKLFEKTIIQQERSNSIFDNLPVGLLVISKNGKIFYENKRFRALSGINLVIGKKINYFRAGLLGKIKEILKGKDGEYNLSICIREQIYELRIHVFSLESFKWMGKVIIVEDVTQLLRAKEIGAWQQVAQKLAHELKNPLTPIQLAAQYIEYIYSTSINNFEEELHKHVSIIDLEIEKLKNMLSEFTQFARLPLPDFKKGNIIDSVDNIISLYKNKYPDIIFNITAEKIPPFLFDSSQIEQVLINIFKNSIEAIHSSSESSGSISVSIVHFKNKKKVILSIYNSGPHIPDELRNKLFSPYISTKKEGSGLGLAITQRIISQHNGKITVINVKKGGVKFIIELPLKET